ncbi:MAG: hypothetical protein QOG52_695, partial [Frankiaceae bacterium]|nr:hypothetical protein [Frankiaceae bacterium]
GVYVAAGLLYGRAERSSVERLGVEAH